MSIRQWFKILLAGTVLSCLQFCLTACSVSPKQQNDYSSYRQLMPRSILILPPTNDSVEINATYSYLSTMTQPFAEKGYYVFPVAVVDVLMKENGLPMPEDMARVSLQKIDEIFGADAVLYVHIKNFGQKYQIISSSSVVSAEARLVDVKSATDLWRDTVSVSIDNSSGQGGLLGMLLEAVITQAITDQEKSMYLASRRANQRLVKDILTGPLHPEFGQQP